MSELDHRAEADRIIAAHLAHTTLDPISDRLDFDMADAYRIQSYVAGSWLGRGEQRAGWKLGYTSAAMREQMGVAEANFGLLTDAMLIESGSDVGGRFTQPRVEPEVALRFGADLAGDATRAAVLDAVQGAYAALEVVDSVWTGYRFRIQDNTADGSSAAGVVLGEEIDLDRISDVEVTLMSDAEASEGVVVGQGHGRDASGHPADGVVWLVEQLARRGDAVRAGDVVITGGLTAATPLPRNSTVWAMFDRVRVVSVRDGRTGLS